MSSTTPPDPEVSQLYCWKEADRICGPDCRAYDNVAAEDDPSRCKLLHIGMGISRHLSRIADSIRGSSF